MTAARIECVVAVAFSHNAEVRAWPLMVSSGALKRIERTLLNLLDLGHVAGFSVHQVRCGTADGFFDELRSILGALTVDACVDAQEVPVTQPPACLMQVWSFDHDVGDLPIASGRLLGLELELIATPCQDEELGACLPGRAGRWLIYAGPTL